MCIVIFFVECLLQFYRMLHRFQVYLLRKYPMLKHHIMKVLVIIVFVVVLVIVIIDNLKGLYAVIHTCGSA